MKGVRYVNQNTEFLPVEVFLEEGSSVATVDWGSVEATTILLSLTDITEGQVLRVYTKDLKDIIRLELVMLPDSKTLTLVAEIYTDAKETPLKLSAPKEVLQKAEQLKVMIRYNGFHLALHLDGVLIDEEWPMGSINLRDATIESAMIKQGRLLNYNISEQEISELFGDEKQMEQRANRLLGEESTSVQYWRPRGFNTGVGDCMPYFDGHTFHIFYLFDRRGHGSKWGLGAHQWAHLSSDNLSDWKHYPLSVAITEQWEGSICTGSIIQDHTHYYAFYAVRAVDGTPARLTWATSVDGVEFEKSGVYIELSSQYHLSSVRDPHVFREDNGTYHMLITTSIMNGDREQGCLAHMASTDLKTWVEHMPFIVPGYHDQPECSDYFEWNGWYYLIFSNDGAARYRYSRNQFGPWMRPAADIIDGVQLRVPKSAAYKEGRRLVVGFLSEPGRYGGELVIRELIQHPDGSLGTNFVEELHDYTDSRNKIETLETFTLENLEGYAASGHLRIENDYYLKFKVIPAYPNMYYGFSLAHSYKFEQGHEVRFDPAGRKMGIHQINGRSFSQDEATSLYHMNDLEQEVIVEAIVKKEYIDLCVNGARTMISRSGKEYAYLRFFSQFGAAEFHNITYRELE